MTKNTLPPTISQVREAAEAEALRKLAHTQQKLNPVTVTERDVHRFLNYDRKTGAFTWRKALSKRCPVGSKAGSVDMKGEVVIVIKGRRFPASHLAWLSEHGEWPAKTLTYRDGDPLNLRIDNLQPCDEFTAKLNRKHHRQIAQAEARPKRKGLRRLEVTIDAVLFDWIRSQCVVAPDPGHPAFPAWERLVDGGDLPPELSVEHSNDGERPHPTGAHGAGQVAGLAQETDQGIHEPSLLAGEGVPPEGVEQGERGAPFEQLAELVPGTGLVPGLDGVLDGPVAEAEGVRIHEPSLQPFPGPSAFPE